MTTKPQVIYEYETQSPFRKGITHVFIKQAKTPYVYEVANCAGADIKAFFPNLPNDFLVLPVSEALAQFKFKKGGLEHLIW